ARLRARGGARRGRAGVRAARARPRSLGRRLRTGARRGGRRSGRDRGRPPAHRRGRSRRRPGGRGRARAQGARSRNRGVSAVAAKAINGVVMSLAALPAYFLARRLLQPGLALVVAALTVAVPSMLYTGTLMTENVFYPLFLVVALALVAMLERPTPLRQVVLL